MKLDPNFFLLGMLCVLTVFGFAYLIHLYGIRSVIKMILDQISAIRAFDMLGIGVRLLGIRPATQMGHSTLTFWVTFLYLPILPLNRHVVQFVDPGMYAARWVSIEKTPLQYREIALTYFWGWIGFPCLLLAPFIVGSMFYQMQQVIFGMGFLKDGNRDLIEAIQLLGTFFAVVIVLLGVPWLGIATYKLLRWDQLRRKK